MSNFVYQQAPLMEHQRQWGKGPPLGKQPRLPTTERLLGARIALAALALLAR